ncbi:MAG TPA: DUF2127 domain-containing protein [Thermodesulfobacteriota bacterium]|nr:DUF2127 domain-containing protein [Thermodesulfobacteriota bacterium]
MGETKKRGKFLKVIIVQKFVTGIIEIVLAFGILRFAGKDLAEIVRHAAFYLGVAEENNFIQGTLMKAEALHTNTILGASLSLFLLGGLALFEAYGLHMRQKWGEWLTVISTSLFIPYEVWILIAHPSIIKLSILVFNCAIVYYLAKHKELFKRKKA